MMQDPIDFCKYFADIERDPRAHPPRLTIRQFYAAREHVQNCDNCYNRTERVLARAPKTPFPMPGEN
jgi:hypothetical protein